MKRLYIIPLLFALVVATGSNANAQAFRKGALLLSVSDGGAYTHYSTTNIHSDVIGRASVPGERDPITLEYGLSNRWGVGINMGGDVFSVSPSMYNFKTSGKDKSAGVMTSEFTADAHYHFFVTDRTDISAVASVGIAGVSIEEYKEDAYYSYHACGYILRGGAEARYYFYKKLNVLAMVTAWSSRCTPRDGSAGNTESNAPRNITTTINGIAWEIGLGYRFLR